MGISVINADENKAGIWYGVVAYTLWGILPLYWKLMQAVPPIEILAHRFLWSIVFMFLLVIFTSGWKTVAAGFADKKKLLLMFLCGILVSINWFTYIFAVNTGHVIEASMGYFINPLVVVILGVAVFKEKMTRWQLAAVILAAIGVLMITVQYGRVPWISLFLAVSFAAYGLVKKIIRVDSITGLTMETLVIMPVALFYIINLEKNAVGALGSAALTTVLFLAGTGVITAVPLIFYARGIEKTTFSMMGFLQYIAPSISLFLGIFIFKEYFSLFHLVSFCFIWAALLIFTLDSVGIIRDPFLVRTEKL
ncbi:MAG: EamA family transporter RarD [Dethiobacteria bacterium]|nr:EamA family transporter RarD [Dethiobacteria bacterium]